MQGLRTVFAVHELQSAAEHPTGVFLWPHPGELFSMADTMVDSQEPPKKVLRVTHTAPEPEGAWAVVPV